MVSWSPVLSLGLVIGIGVGAILQFNPLFVHHLPIADEAAWIVSSANQTLLQDSDDQPNGRSSVSQLASQESISFDSLVSLMLDLNILNPADPVTSGWKPLSHSQETVLNLKDLLGAQQDNEEPDSFFFSEVSRSYPPSLWIDIDAQQRDTYIIDSASGQSEKGFQLFLPSRKDGAKDWIF